MVQRKKELFMLVCAIHEVVKETPHRFFAWAFDAEDAVFMYCPACGSEAIIATPCRPRRFTKRLYEVGE